MMYSRVCWLLLFVITAAVRVDCEVDDIPLIQWEAGCDSYNITSGAWPRVYRIHYQYPTTVAQCRSLCTSRTHCGGFRWSTRNSCYLYNINDHIIEQVTHVSQNWYWSDTRSTWYSKSCGYNEADNDPSCDIYTDRQYHNQYPVLYKWMITYTHWRISDLTATECQAWCTLYTSCRSVTYERYSRNGFCYLYSTTIQDLLDSGLTGDVIQNTDTWKTYRTYDRYCAGGEPYIPDQK